MPYNFGWPEETPASGYSRTLSPSGSLGETLVRRNFVVGSSGEAKGTATDHKKINTVRNPAPAVVTNFRLEKFIDLPIVFFWLKNSSKRRKLAAIRNNYFPLFM